MRGEGPRRRRRRHDGGAGTLAAADATGRELFGGRLTPAPDRDYGVREALPFWVTLRRVPRLLRDALVLAWEADRTALVVVLAAELGQGLTAAFGLLATNQVLMSLFAAGPTPDRVREAAPALALVAVAGAVTALLRAASTAGTGRLRPKVERAAEVGLTECVVRAELEAVEDAEFAHALRRASLMGVRANAQLIDEAAGVVNALVQLAAVGAVLTVLHPLLLPLLVLIVAPQGWGAVRSARRRFVSQRRWVDHERRQSELMFALTWQQFAQEVRAHGIAPYLLDHYRRAAAAHEAEQTRLATAQAGTDLVSGALSGLASALTYAALAWLLLAGHMELAASGTAVLAIRTSSTALGQLVRSVNMMYEQALLLGELTEARRIARERAIPYGGTPVTAPAVVELDEVSYTYPGRDRPAVDKVSLTLRRGRIVALAGENGSGKTTLAKIVAGLYLPQEGTVRWDGTPIGEADRDSVFAQVALVQQDFARWYFTARANVTIGRPAAEGHDEERLASASAYADTGAMIGELPRGWDTLLDRTYEGGVDLSGGQWQRLVLARARYRDAPLVICDEPTAALDAKAEVEAFERIRALAAEGTTVVLVTHRLASVSRADEICVLERGRLVERGPHAELLAAGGVYARMYALQRDQFANEPGLHPA